MKKSLVRLWEIIPGLATWGTFAIMIILAIYNPVALAVFVLFYAVYWLVRIFIITYFLLFGFIRYRRAQKVDWLSRLENDYSGQWEDYYHLAIVPSYKEDISILRHTIDAIHLSNYPKNKLIVVVAFEQRDKELAPKYGPILTQEYANSFGGFLATYHPADIPGEVRGKGPNITWAGRQTLQYIDKRQIPYDKVIVTTLDADNRVDRDYFSNLTWNYVKTPDPIHKSFQPLPMFFNNIWKVPLPVKLTALGSSFWQMIQAMRPHYSRNFSAHAQSLAALIETDFWSVTTIVEDGHQYWRSYFKFDGNHHVVPIPVPVYMDAVQGDNIADTFREQYLQRRRWFWGVSDVPFVFEHSYGNKSIPFIYKWLQFARLFESHYSLATQSFILLIGWLPLLINQDFQRTVVGYNFPDVYRFFLGSAWIGMVVNMLVASLLVPPRPGKRTYYLITLVKEWILAPVILPISGIFFSAIPAIDSQTRLMVHKPFTVFNVTKKAAIPGGIERVSQ
ncbi:MAG: glycosyltransferase family 2 protein [Patescibacteria group bacterium]